LKSVGILNSVDKMECIICQDIGPEPVQDNKTCSCKYKCHSTCWIDYVHSREKVICPLCRKDLTAKKTPKTKSTMYTPLRQPTATAPIITPYTSFLHTIPEESGRQITYQEFVDTIQQYNTNTIEVRPAIQPVILPPKPSTKGEKIVKMIICFGIIIAVIIVIAIFA
jgi:hypothetical protein